MHKYIIEFIGTLCLTLTVILSFNNPYAFIIIGVALAFTILWAIKAGEIGIIPSFNPATTIMYYITNKLPLSEVIPFIIAEILGALCATILFYLLRKKNLY